MEKYYAVKKGKTPGIYQTWTECKENVEGVPGAVFRKFETMAEARDFMNGKTNIPFHKEVSDNRLLKKSQAIAYVDGSFDASSGIYGWGLVFIEKGKPVVELCGADKDAELSSMRNVAGEILAAEKAMELAKEKKIDSLIICYDYQGIAMWSLKKWQRNKQRTIEYAARCEEYRNYMELSYEKIEAHTGNENNEKADKLAKKGISDFKKANKKQPDKESGPEKKETMPKEKPKSFLYLELDADFADTLYQQAKTKGLNLEEYILEILQERKE